MERKQAYARIQRGGKGNVRSYLDIQDILSDEDGYLLPECDSGDGMHLSQMAYTRLLSYITFAMDEAAPAETMQSDTVSEILSDITDTEQSSD